MRTFPILPSMLIVNSYYTDALPILIIINITELSRSVFRPAIVASECSDLPYQNVLP
jgi:hypothetical protein